MADYADKIIHGYETETPYLIEAYGQLCPEDVLAPVAEFLPDTGKVLDVGAGIGTNAVWLASRGCEVAAVEPAKTFRNHGKNGYPSRNVSWHNGRLPMLSGIGFSKGDFDTVLAIGVLHHLVPTDQAAAIETFASLLKPSGRMILSLRHGPCPASRPGFSVSADLITEVAVQCGFDVRHRSENGSIQPANRRAGVTWTWLVLDAPEFDLKAGC
ncbi:class I SAM-dependent methyltransferase [Ruegeria arenilitoris]|uniref:class I SAM-dependent methyltransferase n=1 Tax=Ruegeria arenilitoris TaxID=1173585 RepID=UPI0014801EFD